MLFSAGFVLALPSLLNQSPFYYFDSGFYVLNSIYEVSDWAFLWRPLTYSLFLRVASGLGSWELMMLVQSTVMAGGIYFFSKRLHPALSPRQFLTLIVFLLIFSPIGVLSNFILPDVFMGFALLALSFTLLPLKKAAQVTNIFFLLFASAVHYSNIFTTIVTGLAITARKSLLKSKILLSGIGLSILFIPTVHVFMANQFSFSNTAHIFLFSRFAALGISHEHLDNRCEEMRYRLCEYRELEFRIWNRGHDSQIGRLGGLHEIQRDIEAVNKDILASPLIFKFAWRSLGNISRQIVHFSEVIVPTLDDDYLSKELKLSPDFHFPMFQRQKLKPKMLWVFNSLLKWIYLVATLFSLFTLLYLIWKKKLPAQYRWVLQVVIIGYLANAIICGSLTDPMAKYSNRIIWIFPWLLTLYIMGQVSSRKRI